MRTPVGKSRASRPGEQRRDDATIAKAFGDDARSPLAKVFVIGEDGTRARESSQQLDEEVVRRTFSNAGAVEPPYSPLALGRVFEESNALRQNVEAYQNNIHANGYHLEPILDLDSDSIHDDVAAAIYVERLVARERGQKVSNLVPTDEEVEAEIDRVSDAMIVEKFRVASFIDACTVKETFIELRKKTCQDREATGNSYWEVLRDRADRVAQFEFVPSHQVRLLPQGSEFVEISMPVRVSPLAMGLQKVKVRFRRYAQIVDASVVFFKELGDPRLMSRKTGRYYSTVDALRRAEGKDAQHATEILHWRIHSPSSSYGIPRWSGQMLAVLGNRSAEEVNYLYFENKGVPPMALLVSGGRLSEDSVQKVTDFIDTEIKGKKNFHKILVIEAEPMGPGEMDGLATGRMKIQLVPLTQAQQADALFQKYDERNIDKVGMSFRMPRMLRGDVRDFNRATADAALTFAEAQVFGPERQAFDDAFQQKILAGLGVRYWKFRSNAVQIRDPQQLATIIADLTNAGVLVPADGRSLASELVFNHPLPRIDADWAYQPVRLTQVGVPFDTQRDGEIPEGTVSPGPPHLKPSAAAAGAAPASKAYRAGRYGGQRMGRIMSRKERLVVAAHDLLALRSELARAEGDAAVAELKKGAVEKEPEVEVIRVPLAKMKDLVGEQPAAAE